MTIALISILTTVILLLLLGIYLDHREQRDYIEESFGEIIDSGAEYKIEPTSQTIKEESKTNYFYE